MLFRSFWMGSSVRIEEAEGRIHIEKIRDHTECAIEISVERRISCCPDVPLLRKQSIACPGQPVRLRTEIAVSLLADAATVEAALRGRPRLAKHNTLGRQRGADASSMAEEGSAGSTRHDCRTLQAIEPQR
jgi:hypothetical protein